MTINNQLSIKSGLHCIMCAKFKPTLVFTLDVTIVPGTTTIELSLQNVVLQEQSPRGREGNTYSLGSHSHFSLKSQVRLSAKQFPNYSYSAFRLEGQQFCPITLIKSVLHHASVISHNMH